MPLAKPKRLVLIDGNALIHRAYHALPPLTTKKGELVNAVFGFTSILLRVLKTLQPQYIACTFDLKGKTFRHKEYKEYKAQRVKVPDELYEQIPRVKEIVAAFNIPIYEKEEYEADDLIGTLTKIAKAKKDLETVIVTGDLDVLQLVDGKTKVFTLRKGFKDTVLYDVSKVKKRYGLAPDQMIDYKALRGDPSDNIPGVRGIGEKTAIMLLKKYKTLKGTYDHLNDIAPSVRKKLEAGKEEAELSKRLATIITDIDIKLDLKDAATRRYSRAKVIKIFRELGFRSLLNNLPEAAASIGHNISAEEKEQKELFQPEQKEVGGKVQYRLISSSEEFDSFLKQLTKVNHFAFDTETSGLKPFTDEVLGISFSWQPGKAYYLTLALPEGEKRKRVTALAPIFSNPRIKKSGHNLKFDIEVLYNLGIKFAGTGTDSMIIAYILNPGGRVLKLDDLVFSELGYEMKPITELIGEGKSQKSLAEINVKEVAEYSCEDADYTWRLNQHLLGKLKNKKHREVLEKIEMPLVKVLVNMEEAGIKLDLRHLERLSKQFLKKIRKLEELIYQEAGQKFNIKSTQQLAGVLFDKLGIPSEGIRRTQKSYSTAASELIKLKGKHRIIQYILDFRELTKLMSTYVEALAGLVDERTSRVHTSFNQTITATGRLSSSDPNLQNIPVRTEEGHKIRRAFVAEPGYELVSLDYSQIDLRVAASLANDKTMIKAFNDDEDIHARTASQILGKDILKINTRERRLAKTVNFGIVYGMSAFGLAERTGISREQAQDFIDSYFRSFSAVKKYSEQSVARARKRGYIETLFGRRRYLPEINSSNWQIKQAAERMAINMPIQGTAADIIKLAMIGVNKSLEDKYGELPVLDRPVRMLLQVHDELVFEVKGKEVESIAAEMKKIMEGAKELKVALRVDVKRGSSWGEMEKIG